MNVLKIKKGLQKLFALNYLAVQSLVYKVRSFEVNSELDQAWRPKNKSMHCTPQLYVMALFGTECSLLCRKNALSVGMKTE